jgi:hypothetical protein
MWTVGRFGRFFGVAAGRRSPAQMQPYPIRTPEPDDPPLVGRASVSENRPNRPTVQSGPTRYQSEQMKEIKRHG